MMIDNGFLELGGSLTRRFMRAHYKAALSIVVGSVLLMLLLLLDGWFAFIAAV
jgi:hypothetical protein